MYAKIYPDIISGVLIIKCDLSDFKTLAKEEKSKRFKNWCKSYKVKINVSEFKLGYVLITYTCNIGDLAPGGEELQHQRIYCEIKWWIEDVGEVYNYLKLRG